MTPPTEVMRGTNTGRTMLTWDEHRTNNAHVGRTQDEQCSRGTNIGRTLVTWDEQLDEHWKNSRTTAGISTETLQCNTLYQNTERL